MQPERLSDILPDVMSDIRQRARQSEKHQRGVLQAVAGYEKNRRGRQSRKSGGDLGRAGCRSGNLRKRGAKVFSVLSNFGA